MEPRRTPRIELFLDGKLIGLVRDITYTREAVEQPSDDMLRKLEPGNDIRIDVDMFQPLLLSERWILLDGNDTTAAGDEVFSSALSTWISIPSYKVGLFVERYNAVRRKALVLG